MHRQYEGIVHAHSSNSFDARLTYAELRDFFGARGLQFACMTEHIEELEQADIDRIVDGCRSQSDERFLFVPGIEMDCFFIYFLGIERTAVDFSTNRSIFDSLQAVASLLVFSHPIKARYRYPDWLIERCNAVEVLNSKHDGQHYLRPQSERLHARIREVKPDVVALAGMDFHSPKGYSDVRLRLSRPGPLSEEHVLGSLRGGMFDIVKNGVPLRQTGRLRRGYLRSRIHLMDAAHQAHRTLTEAGLGVPRPVKRSLRRLFEGA